MVVECKRPQDATWAFLVPDGQSNKTKRVRCQWVEHERDKETLTGWYDFRMLPESLESEFCVVRGTGEANPPMIERLSTSLLKSMHCLAGEELQLAGKQKDSCWMIYFPVIITTAELEICRFNPGEVSLKDGKILRGTFEPVPFVRFRKSLTTLLTPNASPKTLQEANQDKERTVIVINASELTTTLGQFKFQGIAWPDEDWPWKAARKIQGRS